jgi:hypothetical protein
MESILYSPVFVLPLFLLAQVYLGGPSNWVTRWLDRLPREPWLVIPVVYVLVSFRPLASEYVLPMVPVMLGLIRVPWSERLGRSLLVHWKSGRPLDEPIRALLERFEEGNFDWEHLEAALWLWMGCRAIGDSRLERVVANRCRRFLELDAEKTQSKFLWPRYAAWRLRSEVLLGPQGRHLLPP